MVLGRRVVRRVAKAGEVAARVAGPEDVGVKVEDAVESRERPHAQLIERVQPIALRAHQRPAGLLEGRQQLNAVHDRAKRRHQVVRQGVLEEVVEVWRRQRRCG